MARQTTQDHATGRSLAYEHVTLLKTETWLKTDTLRNVTVNVPRKSMKAIVLLWTRAGRTDSEEFTYPNIDEVDVSIDGVPNAVYTQGIDKRRFYDEAQRLFETNADTSTTNLTSFFRNRFALVVDLRTHADKQTINTGWRMVNSQNGVLLEIKKQATTTDLKCHVFVVSDGMLRFINNDLQSIQY